MQYGNHSFIIDRKSTTKTNRLLQIILHAGTEGVTREELVGRLWENEEVANPSNSFRAIAGERLYYKPKGSLLLDAGNSVSL